MIDIPEHRKVVIQHLTVPISKVEPRLGQPRTTFDEDALQSLAESISIHGLLQPITVRPLDHGYYQIIAGERRWRACRMVGLYEVPINVIEADDYDTTVLSLIENLQREDLNPVEEARGYKALIDQFDMTQLEVSTTVGVSRPVIANALRLLSLEKSVLEMVERGQLNKGQALPLVVLKKDSQVPAAKIIAETNLSVRDVAKLVEKIKRQNDSKAQTHRTNRAEIAKQAEILSSALQRKVSIVDGKKVGLIILEYTDADDRENLLAAIANLQKS